MALSLYHRNGRHGPRCQASTSQGPMLAWNQVPPQAPDRNIRCWCQMKVSGDSLLKDGIILVVTGILGFVGSSNQYPRLPNCITQKIPFKKTNPTPPRKTPKQLVFWLSNSNSKQFGATNHQPPTSSNPRFAWHVQWFCERGPSLAKGHRKGLQRGQNGVTGSVYVGIRIFFGGQIRGKGGKDQIRFAAKLVVNL